MKLDLETLLNQKSYLSEVFKITDDSFEVSFKLRNQYEIPLLLFFDQAFPAKLPIVAVNAAKSHIPKKPHVLTKGAVCYLDPEGVVWNKEPAATLDFVFQRVEDVLIENDEIIEYHREFNYYFNTLDELIQCISLFPPNNNVEEIYVHTLKDRPRAFTDKDQESIDKLEKILEIPRANKNRAIFISLDKPYDGNVPQQDDFWSANDIQKLVIDNISEEKLGRLRDLSVNKKNYYYLLNIPLLTENTVMIGLWYKKMVGYSQRCNPIIETDVGRIFHIYPIQIFRYDDDSLLERGGGKSRNANLLVVGCGSIGSDLLFLLARSGIKSFTIVDNDKLQLVNSYRHFLGMNKSITNVQKVVLLKEEFEKRYPNVDIKTFSADILDLISEGIIRLHDYDVIIVAIGNPNIERKLNEVILTTDTPAIFTWVEAYGLGGHALVVNNGGAGCYECLYNEPIYNSASFAEKSVKPYTRNLIGCSGTFTPYGGIDSMESAMIAARLVLRLLNGEVNGNPLVSWKGNSKDFIGNGFKTSQRYDSSLDYLEQDNLDYIDVNCECCHERQK